MTSLIAKASIFFNPGYQIGRAALAAALMLGLSLRAHATPITYDFTATNFHSIVNPAGPGGPHKVVSGSMTLEGNELIDLDLMLGKTKFTKANSQYTQGVLGGETCSYICLTGLTNDFLLVLDQMSLDFSALYYSDAAFDNIWLSTTGTVAVSKTPEPGSLALLLCGLLALVARAKRLSWKPLSR